MTKIERLTKKRVEVETMLWDGTDEAATAIKGWVAFHQEGTELVSAFLVPDECGDAHAQLYVAHNNDWCSLQVGYRVAKELNGSGFYPLSPEGAAAGYEMPPTSCTCDEAECTGQCCGGACGGVPAGAHEIATVDPIRPGKYNFSSVRRMRSTRPPISEDLTIPPCCAASLADAPASPLTCTCGLLWARQPDGRWMASEPFCTTGACRNPPTQMLRGEPRCDHCVRVMTAPPTINEESTDPARSGQPEGSTDG